MNLLVGRYWHEWRNSLNNFEETIKELIENEKKAKNQLRFGIHVIPVSSIAK